MKTFKHIAALVVLLLFVLPVEAGDGKALYVHRNDGDFNAFFFSEIDSIVYSKLDVDSVLWDNYVTQEVWTPDTVVRIPLSVIDDISLETPSNIYKEGVMVLDKEKQSYISRCDSLTLYYSLSTPKNQLPHVGEKLVTTDMNELFPIGFLGVVKSIKQGSDYVTVECDQINIEDAFDRYYCVVEGESDSTSNDAARAAKKPIWIPVYLQPIKFDFPCDFSTDFSPNEYCQFGYGMSSESSLEWTPKLRFILANDYGYKYVSICWDNYLTSSTETNAFGHFTVSKEWGKPKNMVVPEIPFTKFYIKFGPRFELSGDIALDYKQSETYVLPYRYIRSSNPNVKYQNGFGKIRRIDDSLVPGMIAGEIKVYGGVYIEIGYGLLIEDWGKIYARGDAGIEFNIKADLAKSIDDAPYSTKLYDTAYEEDLLSVSLDFAYGGTAGVSAAIGPLVVGAKLSDMIKLPLLKWRLFPYFSNVKYSEMTNNNSYLSCNVDQDAILLGSVPVGFKVLDENGKEVFCEYYKKDYSNLGFRYYEIPYSFNKVNSRYTAYPVFKLFGKYEILASPSIDLFNKIKAVTNGASVTKNSASVSGSLDGDIKTLTQQYEVGFFYSTTYTPQKTGKKIKATLSGNGSFNANITNLEGGVTYYYCAYLLVDDKYYYGETRQFKTTKETFMEARTGDPISIENWQAVVCGYAQSDDMNNCEYGVLYNFTGSDWDSWYIAKGENWQDGNFTATLHFFNIDDEVIFYKAYISRGNDYIFGDLKKLEKKILRSCPDDHHPHMIDLGLPSGTKWACCNVGALRTEDYGGYYAWGETKEKASYTPITYLYKSQNIGSDIAGTSYDVAHVLWGNNWCMPTPQQCEELITYCTETWTTLNGKAGKEFRGSNGGSIFLPAAGYREEEWSYDVQVEGHYLYSESTKPNEHWGFSRDSEFVSRSILNYSLGAGVYDGFTVRPVCK